MGLSTSLLSLCLYEYKVAYDQFVLFFLMSGKGRSALDLPPKSWSREAVSEVGLRADDNCV